VINIESGMKRKPNFRLALVMPVLWAGQLLLAQNFKGVVLNTEGKPVEGAEVYMVENGATTTTDSRGMWALTSADQNTKTLVFHKDGYTYEQMLKQAPDADIVGTLRKAQKSAATLREESYIKNGCNTVKVPNDKKWNVKFKISELKGDLAPDPKYTRRDPSAVIKVKNKYYMWYSYSITNDANKTAPWDLNDLYYATSTDGITWKEEGIAVGRGVPGSYDARSVFTTEILAANGKYYLVYQAAADLDGIYNRNVVGMSWANSPDGPWTKLEQPVLTPTYTNHLFFDNNAVHDPCIVPYQGKFYLYYKGECNCRDNAGCVRWCNPICGLKKQVKWGVAIADKPTGPYVKSVKNPITNTGHEVMVWPFAKGMAILQHQDGPEPKTIQFSENGFDFNIMGGVENIPEAAGLFRAPVSKKNPHAGITWGVGHKLNFVKGQKSWMNIYRFDLVKE